MHLPRQQIAQLYTHLLRSTHSSSAPLLVLTALTVDSLCATRILAALLRRDFLPHTIIPVAGYADLQRVGAESVLPMTRQRGGDGGTVACLGLGGPVAIEEILGLDGGMDDEEVVAGGAGMENHGVEVWLIDSHRPWRLENVFGISAAAAATGQDSDGGRDPARGVREGKVLPSYRPGRGGVIVWDDGDVEAELQTEKEAFLALQGMPDITEDDVQREGEDEEEDSQDQDQEDDADPPSSAGQKRKRDEGDDPSSAAGSDVEDDEERSPRRRRSNSNSSIAIPSSPGGNPLSAQVGDASSTAAAIPSSPPKPPSSKQMRKELLRLRRRHEGTLMKYYAAGASTAEPVSSMLYSLASELGREDNELLWLAVVGISSASAAPLGSAAKITQIREVLQDEVRRLNPIPDAELQRSQSADATIPTTARSPTDTSIRLSPEPRFLLIRHWSLYDAMLHSPYLATRLHVWSDLGRKRLHKLLAKMGISLQEAGKGYLHMDSEIKRTLRKRILKFAEQYNLDGLVPSDNGRAGLDDWGFVRSWGWRGTLSAEDVSIVVGAILEVGPEAMTFPATSASHPHSSHSYNARIRTLPTPPHSSDDGLDNDGAASHSNPPDYITQRFFQAYDALAPSAGLARVLQNIPVAQALYRAILRVGSAILAKKQIRHLHAFRMAVVKEGPDVPLFTHPGALARLAAWIREAFAVIESEQRGASRRPADDAWVLAALDEGRGTYVVIGLGGNGGWCAKRIRSKAEIKAREEKRKRRADEKAAAQLEKRRKREERRRLRRERNAANGIFEDEDEEEGGWQSESETETASSMSSEEEEDDDDDDSASEDEDGAVDEAPDGAPRSGGRRRKGKRKGYGRLNRFGVAFQETVEETGASVRVDSFEHSVVEVGKEDFAQFLQALSRKSVVGRA